mgnify:CR=1 FL=1
MVLDINVTSTCNLGCKYCSEGHNPDMPDLAKIENSKTDVKTQELINFISKVKESRPDEVFTIAFWGGEPMMNMPYCLDLMLYYKDDKNVNFFFYTNGTYIEKYRDSIKNINSLLGQDRFEIQISYDGKPINDIERVTKKDKSTSDEVKRAFEILGEIGVRRKFKSTITPRTFKYIYESYVDLISIPGNENYFPTPDSYNDYDPEKTEEYFNDLKVGLAKIAKHIYDNKLRLDTFGWFRNNKALCQTGINYYGINLDGKLSPCHSTMYDTFNDHEIGDIRDEDIVKTLEDASEGFKKLLNHMNDDCTGCNVLYCMKCPAASYNLPSTNATVDFKLSDFTNNPHNLNKYELRWTTKNINMCKVFKLNDIIYKSLLYVMKQSPVQANAKRCERY